MNTAPPEVKTIFSKALEIESWTERAAYLNRACGGNAVVRREVEGLLQAMEKAGSFMKQPAIEQAVGFAETADEPSLAEKPGTLVGPYKLLELCCC